MVLCSGAESKVSRHGLWSAQSSEGRRIFRGKGRSLGKSIRSVVTSCPTDGVGSFLMVHFQHIIFVFDSSGDINRGQQNTKLSYGMFLQLRIEMK